MLWENAGDEQLQLLANNVRNRFHAANKASYMLMRIINYTTSASRSANTARFTACPKQEGTYLRSKEYIYSKIDELVAIGGELFAFNGGFNPELKIDYYVDLFGSIRQKYGNTIELLRQ